MWKCLHFPFTHRKAHTQTREPFFFLTQKAPQRGGNKYTSTTISEKTSKQGGRISDENRWLSLSLYIQFRRRSRSCDAVVVHWWSVETTPFDDAVAHSINQSGAPSSASASRCLSNASPQLLERRLESGDTTTTADAAATAFCLKKRC